jgi:hypothetical protein
MSAGLSSGSINSAKSGRFSTNSLMRASFGWGVVYLSAKVEHQRARHRFERFGQPRDWPQWLNGGRGFVLSARRGAPAVRVRDCGPIVRTLTPGTKDRACALQQAGQIRFSSMWWFNVGICAFVRTRLHRERCVQVRKGHGSRKHRAASGGKRGSCSHLPLQTVSP